MICSGETILHRIAKILVASSVTRWKNGDCGAPSIERECAECGVTIIERLPNTIIGASVEYRLPSGFVTDVAVLDGNGVFLGIEIFVTHKVDDNKKSNLEVPYIELDANHVLNDSHYWSSISDILRPTRCRGCKWKHWQANRSVKHNSLYEKKNRGREDALVRINELERLHEDLIKRIQAYENVESVFEIAEVKQHPELFTGYDKIEVLVKVFIYLKYFRNRRVGKEVNYYGHILKGLRKWGLEFSGNIPEVFLLELTEYGVVELKKWPVFVVLRNL
jgi:hypothetical protein